MRTEKRKGVARWLCAISMACALTNAFAATGEASHAAPIAPPLQQEVDALAARARPGQFGIAVLDLSTGATASVNARQAFPMMSVFKAPVAAAVLARVDAGQLSLSQQVTLTRADLVRGSAVPSIGAHFQVDRMRFTVEQLLEAAVSQSDNTAVDALIRLLGGPAVVTDYLRRHGIEGMRVDLGEAGVGRILENLGPGETPPVGETDAQEQRRYQRGFATFLADPRNRSTPDAAIGFLHQLWNGQLLSAPSTRRLLSLMEAQTLPARLRNGLPAGVWLADKCGTSATVDGLTPAYNDIGILRWPDGRVVLVAAFLMASRTDQTSRDALFADLARTVSTSVHPGH